MAMYAPESPSLQDLRLEHPLKLGADIDIEHTRAQVSGVLAGERRGLVVIEGPCAMTLDREIIDREGDALYDLQNANSSLVALHRMPPWKPRTNPNDWHGLESEPTTVRDAYRTIVERAEATANVAIELGHAPHLDRYGEVISLGWIGSRNAGNNTVTSDILNGLATDTHESLPVGVKNAMDGTLDSALQMIDTLHRFRNEQRDGGAPAVVIYRGGQNAQTPKDWTDNYRRALERTDGRLIVDTAHGGEMAFDPEGNYQKSVVGQVACLEQILAIAEEHGEMPAGIMMEASGAASPTDPVMPFRVALSGARRLHELKMSRVGVSV